MFEMKKKVAKVYIRLFLWNGEVEERFFNHWFKNGSFEG